MKTWDMTIGDYISELSSKAPAPGGGGASALAGGLGTALGQMVCNLTKGKKKYSEYENEITEIEARLHSAQLDLIELSDKDAEIFIPLSKAYQMPHATSKQIEAKEKAMEPLLADAAQVPIDIMKLAYNQLEDLRFLMKHGSIMAVSDVGVAALMIRTAVLGAYMNVIINTKSMKDRKTADEMNSLSQDLREKTIIACDDLYDEIREILA